MRKFKTESKRLLDLMINSIYTNKEIFLRELISNGSDALDKVYMEAMKAGDNTVTRSELNIRVDVDDATRTITVADNGIGMDKDSMEKNLGTIAHSGSLEFKSDDEVKESDEVDIIGQFGVGFYSSFMVADHVKVISKAYGSDQAYVWDSDGLDGYSITEGERDERGTTVILSIRESSEEFDYDRFLNARALQNLIKRYSDYVRYPILMESSKTVPLPNPEDAGDDWKQEYNTITEVETINSMIPIWTKKKSEVTDEEYNEFYKSQFHETKDPARVISIHAEGNITYDALLFIPAEPPRDMYSKDFQKGLALYSSNVMIMEKCADVLPDCFGFVQGVIDSPDLSLNISRETLQQSRELAAIERRIEKKIKNEFANMRDDDREEYEKLYAIYGHSFKYSIYSSYGAKGDLLEDLLMFRSALKGSLITFDEYNIDATEDQHQIYFASGDSVERLAKTANVKAVTSKGYDVLLCGADVDEFCLMTMGTYGGKTITNVASGDLELETEEEKDEAKRQDALNADLFADMAATLGDKVVRVGATTIPIDGACCMTTDGPVSLAMEKYFQTLPNAAEAPKAERVLELNMSHPVVEALLAAHEAGDTDKVASYTEMLHYMALIAEGLEIDDPTALNEAICKLMA